MQNPKTPKPLENEKKEEYIKKKHSLKVRKNKKWNYNLKRKLATIKIKNYYRYGHLDVE